VSRPIPKGCPITGEEWRPRQYDWLPSIVPGSGTTAGWIAAPKMGERGFGAVGLRAVRGDFDSKAPRLSISYFDIL
jgi:hypothetical protein